MIINKIKEFRAWENMKQEDLAKLVGVRRETIGNLEKGRYNPSLVLAWNIAKKYFALQLRRYSPLLTILFSRQSLDNKEKRSQRLEGQWLRQCKLLC